MTTAFGADYLELLGATAVTAVAFGIVWRIFLGRSQKFITKEIGNFCEDGYFTKIIKAPRLSGFPLKLMVSLLENVPGAGPLFFKLSDMDLFRNMKLKEAPSYYPNSEQTQEFVKKDYGVNSQSLTEDPPAESPSNKGFRFVSIEEMRSKYKSKVTTPSKMTELSFKNIEKMKALNIFIKLDKEVALAAAEASTKRYQNGQPLSEIDGIIVAVKDEYNVKGLPCKFGTVLESLDVPCEEDCTIVKRLRDLGAIVIGITNMHEIGIGTTGINPNRGFGACRNPYKSDHVTGGSSSGSAAAVASGICTFTIGSDGGGSVRIPSAFCGLVGLKPTFARFSLGKTSACKTITHAGPLCGSVEDAALVNYLIGGADEFYEAGAGQPKPTMPAFTSNLEGVKICYDPRWFKDCSDEIYKKARSVLETLREFGATVDEVNIAELYENLVAHRLIILSEMLHSSRQHLAEEPSVLSWPTRALLVPCESITQSDYMTASQQRTRMMDQLKQIFRGYAAVVTPSTGIPPVRIHEGDLATGPLDAEETTKILK